MTNTPHPPSKPWYREPWVWFLLFFPIATIFAGLTTVVIANQNADAIVPNPPTRIGLGQYTPQAPSP